MVLKCIGILIGSLILISAAQAFKTEALLTLLEKLIKSKKPRGTK